jgi:hypothetical protein
MALTADETRRLISADKVEGTAVYNPAGENVGTIRNIFIDKRSGQVAYASMAYGGVLGMGQKYHALPWDVLTYNTNLGGYQLDVEREKLQGAPVASEEELLDRLEDDAWGRQVHDYYGSPLTRV